MPAAGQGHHDGNVPGCFQHAVQRGAEQAFYQRAGQQGGIPRGQHSGGVVGAVMCGRPQCIAGQPGQRRGRSALAAYVAKEESPPAGNQAEHVVKVPRTSPGDAGW
jgi:hypothetical protein